MQQFTRTLIICWILVMTSLFASNYDLEFARLRSTTAILVLDSDINIDGKLDESIWENGEWEGDFIQRNPNDGQPETYRTEFCIFYDNEFLYVGARAHDPNPDKIIAILSRRDDYTESDWLYVSIDSYNDNRTAFEFGLNAAGVKHDLRRYNDGNMDDNWDAIWDGKTQINDSGWSAEWRIPFRELRFTSSNEMEWGLQVYRELPRHDNELSVWSYWSQAEEGFVSNYGSLNNLKDIKSERPLYISPYIAGQANISDNLISPLHKEKYDLLSNIGGDIRYSGSNGFTLNATINPDFGQVEADPADFNLTEFETYFPEKRAFFMEGGNIFNFALGFGDGGNRGNSLFYSRRIGRAPQGRVISDSNKDIISIDRPVNTRILGATKITGKSSNGFSIGIMEGISVEEKATVLYADGSQDNNVIEPLTNYFLSRFQQDYNDGQTTIGGILTGVNRRLDGTEINYLHKAAYSGGLDFETKLFDRQYAFQAAVAFSHVSGDTIAIQKTQRNSARYFQRTDADHLTYDPTRKSLSGNSFKGVFSKTSRHVRAAIGIVGYSPGFEINDMGFIRNVDDINQFVWIQYYEWEPSKYFRSYRINFNQWTNWTFDGFRKNINGNVNMHFTFHNNWRLGYGINPSFGGYDVSMNRGGPTQYVPKGVNFWTYLNSDQRKDIALNVFGMYYQNVDDVYSSHIEPRVTWRPKQNLKISTSIAFNQLDDTWAWIGKGMDENGEIQYFWSGMLNKMLSLNIRADYTVTTNLSLQYYAQPYFVAGEYFDFLMVNDPLAVGFDERFTALSDEEIQYNYDNGQYMIDRNNDGVTDYSFFGDSDYNYKQFRSNFVLRWEFITGSSAYLVWSQGYTNYEPFKKFNFKNDIETLFGDVGNNVFMIKVSYNL